MWISQSNSIKARNQQAMNASVALGDAWKDEETSIVPKLSDQYVPSWVGSWGTETCGLLRWVGLSRKRGLMLGHSWDS